jgi:hypothetical protein
LISAAGLLETEHETSNAVADIENNLILFIKRSESTWKLYQKSPRRFIGAGSVELPAILQN